MHLNQPSIFSGDIRYFSGDRYSSSHPSRLWQPSTLLGAAWCATCNASTSASESDAPLGQSSTANDTILRGEKCSKRKKSVSGKRAVFGCFLKQMGFWRFLCFLFFAKKKQKMEKIEELPFLIFFMLKVNNHERSNGSMGQKLKAESEDFLHIQCVPRWLASA